MISSPATGSYIVPQRIKSAFGSFDISIKPNFLDEEKIVLELERDESDIHKLSLKRSTAYVIGELHSAFALEDIRDKLEELNLDQFCYFLARCEDKIITSPRFFIRSDELDDEKISEFFDEVFKQISDGSILTTAKAAPIIKKSSHGTNPFFQKLGFSVTSFDRHNKTLSKGDEEIIIRKDILSDYIRLFTLTSHFTKEVQKKLAAIPISRFNDFVTNINSMSRVEKKAKNLEPALEGSISKRFERESEELIGLLLDGKFDEIGHEISYIRLSHRKVLAGAGGAEARAFSEPKAVKKRTAGEPGESPRDPEATSAHKKPRGEEGR